MIVIADERGSEYGNRLENFENVHCSRLRLHPECDLVFDTYQAGAETRFRVSDRSDRFDPAGGIKLAVDHG